MPKLFQYNGKEWLEIARNGQDGQSPDIQEIVKLVLSNIPIPKNGTDGKDGSPDTGEDIVKKINELEATFDKQIDAKHIKNLPKGNTIHPFGGGKVIELVSGTNISVDSSSIQYPIINLNIPVQATEPTSPVFNMLWIDSAP